MLNRLRIRGRLILLLVIPLAAAALTITPFTIERVTAEQATEETFSAARAAREVGVLIQDLQQERLLALGFLAIPELNRSAFIGQSATSADDAARLAANPATAPVLGRAAEPLDALTTVRRGVLERRLGPVQAYSSYRAATVALLDGLQLTEGPAADADGLRQLDALDALMRANEEATSVGANLMATVSAPDETRALLNAASSAKQQYDIRFRQLATPDQAALVDDVEEGKAAERLGVFVLDMTRTDGRAPTVTASEALTAAISYTGLRRVVQDRVAREIAVEAQRRERSAEYVTTGVVGGSIALFILVVVLGVLVSRSISRPLARLTAAATVMADVAGAELVRVADTDDPSPPPARLAAVEVDSADEVGELADALNRVQATAALMLQRQVSMRRNVAVMFANIARRTQNLVGRQLTLIDELERNERSPDMLGQLYRLDHVATRLRRSADSLLVVSGTTDSGLGGSPATLFDVLRSALSEIERYQAVELRDVAEVAVSPGLVADLRLLVAELLENAVSFSPPGSTVDISAVLESDHCRITVVDHGVGLSDERMAEENRRLVERERLDVAPTTVLGLFVVGRIARRHGLSVRLDHTLHGQGVTATVRVPIPLLAPASIAHGSPLAFRPRPVPAVSLEPGSPFGWFDPNAVSKPPPASGNGAVLPAGAIAAIEAARAAGPPSGPFVSVLSGPPTWPPAPPPSSEVTHAGLERRQPGEHVGMFESDLHRPVPPPPVLSAPPRPAAPPLPSAPPLPATPPAPVERPGKPEVRNGLTRRVPGSHLTPQTRASVPPPKPRPGRDPEAEREALEGFFAGFARGEESATVPAVPSRPHLPEIPE